VGRRVLHHLKAKRPRKKSSVPLLLDQTYAKDCHKSTLEHARKYLWDVHPFHAIFHDLKNLATQIYLWPAVMKRISLGLFFPLFLLLLLLFPNVCHAQSEARTLPRSLDQLTAEAGVIVHGYVVSTKVEPHPQLHNLMTVAVTVNVLDTYKGKAQKSLVFRQYIWDIDPTRATAVYGKGKEMVLFLRPVSEYGLTSPAGLNQGVFHVSRTASGQAIVANGFGNRGLFNSIQERAQTQGLRLSAHALSVMQQAGTKPLLLTDLEELIRTFARTQ
jgi:hypothetical protein